MVGTTNASVRPISSAESKKSNFRSDIQGLRAVAVLLVVANHLCAWPSGGYVGVDVFFVISGFLITSQLIREQQETGWISLAGFYARRIRRIVPVALAVASVTIIAGYALWHLPRANQSMLDAVSSALWVSNWHFAATGTNYLQASGPVSPAQHYWSLSVEEQFYVLWPWVIMGLAALAAGLRLQKVNRIIVTGVGFLSVLSLVWAIYLTGAKPALAYFDTFSRAWEFGVGALLAVAAPALRRARAGLTIALPAGIVLIFVGALYLTEQSRFPGPWALLPVAGAALVIVSGGHGVGRVLLVNRGAQFLGHISYSLYLWHFPVIVLLDSLLQDLAWFVRLPVQVVLMVWLSVLSYHHIEERFRKSKWLRAWERRNVGKRRQMIAAALALPVILALVLLQFRGPEMLRDSAALSRTFGAQGPASADHVFQSEQEVAQRVLQAVQQPNVEDTIPSIDALGSDDQGPAMNETTGCLNNAGTANPRVCTFSGGTKRALILGDSVAMSWASTVRGAFPQNRWEVKAMGFASCSPYAIDSLPTRGGTSFIDDCRQGKARMQALAMEYRPDVVILSSAMSTYSSQRSILPGLSPSENWQNGVAETLTDLHSIGADVIVLSPPPPADDLRVCGNRAAGTNDCIRSIGADWDERSAAEVRAVDAASAQGMNVRYVNVRSWFCTAEGECPSVIDGYVARFDVEHLTHAYGQAIAPVLAAAIGDVIAGQQ